MFLDETGRLFERRVLGRCGVRWEDEGYLSFWDAMADVIRSQPWDPRDPAPRPANDFHASVALALGIEAWEELRLFTAVGSALDRFHGVDGFFEFRGKVVTFDLTTNPVKDGGNGFDHIIIQKRELEESLPALAEAVAHMLTSGRR